MEIVWAFWRRKHSKLAETEKSADDDEGEGDIFASPVVMPITDEIDLHGFSPKETLAVVIEYLQEASNKGFEEVRIVHGKGIGVQRRIVQTELQRNPLVQSFQDAPVTRGGLGATIVYLKRR